MCVVLQKTTTATAQNRNKQKKHETRLCFLFVCCFLSCSCSFTCLGQTGYCASEMHHLFIATWADIHIHQCTTYMYDTQRDDWQQNLQGLASVERPLLICSEVMRWNSSNHFIKTSPRLVFFCGTYVVSLVAWSLGEVVEAQCWLSSQFIRHNQAISRCLLSSRPADNGGRSCCHRG